SHAGTIFLTGHDPDFHSQSDPSENPTGAQHIIQRAVDFILDPAFNPFADSSHKLLFVESSGPPPGGHRVGAVGMVDSGFVPGVDCVTSNASTLNADLNLLGSVYSGIVVASDFGGILTQAELNILDARSGDIIDF